MGFTYLIMSTLQTRQKAAREVQTTGRNKSQLIERKQFANLYIQGKLNNRARPRSATLYTCPRSYNDTHIQG